MKTFVLAFVLAAALPALPALAQSTPAARPAATGMATVRVNGLVCDFCVQALTKTFRKQAAVRSFHVDLDAKELHIGFAAGQTLDDATIRRLVIDAGYAVVGIDRAAA